MANTIRYPKTQEDHRGQNRGPKCVEANLEVSKTGQYKHNKRERGQEFKLRRNVTTDSE